jgi:gamma-glutamylcyclotransferase (GGCT)/AIG2-like uncharacterized protein YtfP
VSDFLFVYGTLLPGLAPPEIAPAVAQLRPVAQGSVQGVLYDLGEYPGAVIDLPEVDLSEKEMPVRGCIPGMIFQIPNPRLLRQLDEYEGFDPAAPAASLFVRKLHEVRLDDGRTLSCWVYVYNQNPGNARKVPLA